MKDYNILLDKCIELLNKEKNMEVDEIVGTVMYKNTALVRRAEKKNNFTFLELEERLIDGLYGYING